MLSDGELHILCPRILKIRFLRTFNRHFENQQDAAYEPRAGNFLKNPGNYFCKKSYLTSKKGWKIDKQLQVVQRGASLG